MWKYFVFMIVAILLFFFIVFSAVKEFATDLHDIQQERLQQIEEILDK